MIVLFIRILFERFNSFMLLSVASWFVFTGLIFLAIFLFVRFCKGKPSRWYGKIGLILIEIIILLSAWKLIYYFDGRDVEVAPELIMELDTEQPSSSMQYAFYKIPRFPFTLDSEKYIKTDCFSKEPEIEAKIRDVMIDTDHYTYLISFGYEIDTVTYNHWDSREILPTPWDGAIMTLDWEGSKTFDGNKVYVYRIPAAPVSFIP